ncbi:MAG: undecaprenyl-diphosphate phosphatase [Bdellovibrio sp.]|nr:undecaprenyl-diphosphate phosphatase [Bdellovibrio sp.]
MTTGQAVLLGLVEGVTEYLPVSSTGHLLLTQHLLGIETSGNKSAAILAYEICIQSGAILAVLFLYAGRVRSVLAGILGRDQIGRRLAFNLLIAFLPAAVIGVLFEKLIKAHLFGMWPVVTAWVTGGIAILLVSRRSAISRTTNLGQQLENLTISQALMIGSLQCIAMWPGVSRSLVTILGGVLVGLSTVAAIEFSFLLGLVTLSAATLFEAFKYGPEMIQVFGISNPLIGLVTACIAAIIAVKWMVTYLGRSGMALFGYYRIALGSVVAGLMFLGFM